MKNKWLKKTLLFLSTATILFFTSCKKDHLPPVLSNLIQDTLSGKEFIFDGLTWESDWSITTPVRRDLFRYSYLNINVSLKFDTASNWIAVEPALRVLEETPPYLYSIDISSGVCIINNYTFHHSLLGRKAIIKVKFL